MIQGEGARGERFELHRIEEETGFKPNQLVVHKVTGVRGRAKGYFTEDGRMFLVVKAAGLREPAADLIDQWKEVPE